MTGLRFLFRVTLRRLDLATRFIPIREPAKITLGDEPRTGTSACWPRRQQPQNPAFFLKVLSYGCGLRAGEEL